MTGLPLRILIAGGYGVFGGRLVQLLAHEKRLTLIIAGRSLPRAQAFCAQMQAQEKVLATLEPAKFDRTGDCTAQLDVLKPDIVVDASGPFQGYGAEPYRLVQAAISLGMQYLDLADGSQFVAGISRFDAQARERGVFILSGVSSFPVLTAAVCRQLANGLKSVETITGGIAPSPYAGVGLNVIRAIAGYAGKPLPLRREGRPAVGYGLTETMRVTIGPPGHVPLKNTLFSLVDVPDLVVLPQLWPNVQSVWMGAGPVPEVLHKALVALATGVRWRLLPSLTFLAPLFLWVINTVRWGEHRGGMFVEMTGALPDGTKTQRSWHLLAEGDHGPLIPSMAIAAIVQKILAGQTVPTGARAGVADLELDDYEAIFASRTIVSGFRETRADAAKMPIYQRLLGAAFDVLPPTIRTMHTVTGTLTAAGTADVERGRNLFARVIAAVFGFPRAAKNVPLTVRFSSDGHTETWTRTFGTRSFSSLQREGGGLNDKLLVEQFGPFSFALALVCTREKLSLVLRRWSCFGLSMPRAWAPYGDAYEYERDGRFHFDVEIRLPLIGRLVHYRGWLVPSAPLGNAVHA